MSKKKSAAVERIGDGAGRPQSGPGWEAIDRALKAVYGDVAPRHYPGVPSIAGGPDPLQGVSAFKNLQPRPHWHFVTYGFTELFAKEWEDPNISGFGFELTFRLSCGAKDPEPPSWAVHFLQNLGRWVFRSRKGVQVGQHLDLQGPIAPLAMTDIRAVLFARDVKLNKKVKGPFGQFEFLQVVGITLDELDVLKDWRGEGLLDLLAESDPFLVTDLERRSILRDEKTATRVKTRAAKEGSSLNELVTPMVRWSRSRGGKHVALKLGAAVVDDVLRLLKGRIEHDRPFRLLASEGDNAQVLFEPARKAGFRADKQTLQIQLSRSATEELKQTLRPERGHYEIPSIGGLTVTVEPTEIKDARGNVLHVVG